MGNSSSNLTEEEKRQRERERLLRERGVFVPPVFAVGLDQDAETCWVDSPSRREARHYDRLLPSVDSKMSLPSSLSYVWLSQQEDPSYRILNDYMKPGLWFQSVSNDATVLASLLYEINPKESSIGTNNSEIIGSKQGRLLVGRSLGGEDQVSVRLQGGTDGLPRLASQVRINDALTLGLSANQEGQGWLSLAARIGEVDAGTGDGKIQVEATSVLPWDLQNLQKNDTCVGKLNLTGSVGTGRNGWRLVADTKLNMGSLQAEDTRLFGTVTLQEGVQSVTDAISPVQLSLELNENISAVALTQRIAFDRFNFNIADDRCPSVRNTVGWTLRMEQPMPSASEENKVSPKVMVGGVWQLNRALALKATIHDENVTGAILCRRWAHPRVTCSILGRYHWPTQRGSLLGIGLEIETGRFEDNTTDEDVVSKSAASGVSIPGSAPPTKVKLPTSATSKA